MHAPSEDKSNDSKDRFYKELEQVFDHFLRYYMRILLGDFNAKVGRENIFKPIYFTDRIFCIRQILEKKWENNEAVHQLFIDFK